MKRTEAMTAKTTKGNMKSQNLSKLDLLIYELLFSDRKHYEIELKMYLPFSEDRTEFKNMVMDAVMRGGRGFAEDRFIHRDGGTFWKIEITR